MNIIVEILLAVIVSVMIGGGVGYWMRRRTAEAQIGSAEEEAKKIETYMIPDFDNHSGIISNSSYYMIYGQPVQPIELCPQCKKRLEFLLNDFLEDSNNA